jgi:hypothetical protein
MFGQKCPSELNHIYCICNCFWFVAIRICMCYDDTIRVTIADSVQLFYRILYWSKIRKNAPVIGVE